MARIPRFIALLGALLAFGLAAAVIAALGLPDPARLLALEPFAPGEQPVAPEPGALAPDFTALNGAGEPVRLSDLRGGPVILNFWATWCVPCAAELPALQSVYVARQTDGLRVLAVNAGEAPDLYLPWAAAHGLTFDLLPDPAGTLNALYWVRGLPQTFVIDAQGTVAARFFGPVTAAEITAALDTLPTTSPRRKACAASFALPPLHFHGEGDKH